VTRLSQDDSAKGVWQETWIPLNADKVESGNQGKVIEVRHVKTDQRGALKLMHDRDKHHKERIQRFKREASIRRQLVHPGLPAILDANLNESVDTELFFVAEWIEGKTLQDLFGGRPTTVEEAVRLSFYLAQIVDYCHRNGVLHRDIKPSNIILRQQDQLPVLVDFGLAWKEEYEDEHLSSGQELGNRFLRLADNIIGEDFDDPKTDITFIVGILFFLLTGLAPRSVPHKNGRPPHEVLSGAIPAEVTGHERWKAVRTSLILDFRQMSADVFKMRPNYYRD
jgi:serine/threonine protein kinase